MTKENQTQEDLVLSINLSDAQRKLATLIGKVREEAPGYIKKAKTIANNTISETFDSEKHCDEKCEKCPERECCRRRACCQCPRGCCNRDC